MFFILYALITEQYKMHQNKTIKWIDSIKNILEVTGQIGMFTTENLNSKLLVQQVKHTLEQQYIEKWTSTLQESTRLTFYKQVKSEVEFEKYLKILPYREALTLCQFRTLNHQLPIETMR